MEAYTRAKIKEQLDARGNELDAEFQFIERTKSELNERQKKLTTNEEIQAYNCEVEQLQQINAEYKERVETYNQEVVEFNDQVQEQENP